MKAYAVLTPSASKRLIAKGVSAHPSVRNALAHGTLVVTLGTTNGYVAEELLGEPIDRAAFAAGMIDGEWRINPRLGEATDLILVNGKRSDLTPDDLLSSLTAGDVIIKGGNAIDPFGTVGVLMGSESGGTVGRYVPLALARGVEIVIPISVGKSVHSPISELSLRLGSRRFDLGEGIPCGMFPLVGNVITELEAIESLFGVSATHVASGGIGRGTGSVSLLIEGENERVRSAYELLRSLSRDRGSSGEGER